MAGRSSGRLLVAARGCRFASTSSATAASRRRFIHAVSARKSDTRPANPDEEYRPATTWENLEWIGTPEWKAGRRALQRQEMAEVFPAVPLRLERAEIEHFVRNMVVETFVLRQLDRIDDITDLPFPSFSSGLWRTARFESKTDESVDSAELRFGNDGDRLALERDLTAALEGQGQTEAVELSDGQNVDGGAEVENGDFWREAPLADGSVKFAIVRRFLQLTGHRVPDSYLACRTVGDLADRLVDQVQDRKKVAELLLEDADLAMLPNVNVSAKPVTFADKETELGRWKLVTAELNRLRLPLTTRG